MERRSDIASPRRAGISGAVIMKYELNNVGARGHVPLRMMALWYSVTSLVLDVHWVLLGPRWVTRFAPTHPSHFLSLPGSHSHSLQLSEKSSTLAPAMVTRLNSAQLSMRLIQLQTYLGRK